MNDFKAGEQVNISGIIGIIVNKKIYTRNRYLIVFKDRPNNISYQYISNNPKCAFSVNDDSLFEWYNKYKYYVYRNVDEILKI